jgi:hypothetical protein
MPSMITHVMKVTMSVSLSAYRQDSAPEIAGIPQRTKSDVVLPYP